MKIAFAIAFFLSITVCEAQEETIVIGLIGDSTVAVQSGWGPALAERFDRRTIVHNYARNGATLQSLSRRLDELVELKPDYVLIQFGHNDQKRYDTEVYGDQLRSYVERISKAGGKAVIVSSVTRRTFDADGKIVSNHVRIESNGREGTLTDYAHAAEVVAEELNLPFIDLHHASIAHHNKIGRDESMTYNFKEGDRTHFNRKGAEAISELIVQELKGGVPELAGYLKVADPPEEVNRRAKNLN
jgi:lysophospholipase L1-like esterase